MKRTLTLTSESLTELTSEQMSVVVGGAQEAPPTLRLAECLDTLQPTRCMCP